jgi:polysaccharide pyruvyl transferase WcaK-like protein
MMDQLLETWVAGLIETAKLRWMMGSGSRWRPGQKLKLLFAGYNGTRNTGADVRVEEMMRQIEHILGPDRVELSVLSQNFNLSRGYFGKAKQVMLPDIFPPFLYREIPKYDGVVACEGSMFKSKFANALTTMMIGSLGIASAQNRLSVGYGAEAGHMDPLLARMCSRYCRDSLVITRNEESREVLRDLGIASELGTDTAWTFEPHPPAYAEKTLRAAGWDGKMPLLALCPINPFWWPVRASLLKGIARATVGGFKKSHYRSIYFHNAGPHVDKAYQRYLTSFARAVELFRKDYPVFPILASMEALDADACHRVAAILGGGAPVFRADSYDMYQMVSVLRRCDMMVSSRFHGIVTAMPGLVASAGITMDERIRNLMRERGQPELLLEVDDPDLEAKLGVILRRLVKEKESIQAAVGRTVVSNLKTMARMGVYFEEHVQRRYPEFPVRTGVYSWENYLPPLSPNLQRLAESYGG